MKGLTNHLSTTDTVPPVSGIINAWDGPVDIDGGNILASTPLEIHISLADLPALLNGSIVGITLEQMDSLTSHMIECDADSAALVLFQTKLDTAYMKIEERDSVIQDLKITDDLNTLELKNKNWLIDKQDEHIAVIEKKVRRQPFKTTISLIFGVIIGVIVGTTISN